MNSPVPSGDDAVIGRALVRSLFVFLAIAVVGGALYAWVRLSRSEPAAVVVQAKTPEHRKVTGQPVPPLPMVDVTQQAGIDFMHRSGVSPSKLLPETMGSGVAFFDYNNDGNPDLLFVNSQDWPWETANSSEPAVCRLYVGDGDGKFRDVTEQSGLDDVSLYGMGVAIGDYDNDGWTDVFLSAVGTNRLLKNQQGRFEDVTATAGVGGEADAWSTSSAMFDYDKDGLLDLFVCNYVEWSREIDMGQSFTLIGVGRAYGPPRAFAGTFPYLYHNEGDGTFRDVSAEAGVQIRNRDTNVPLAKGMGVAPADVDGDGWMDVIVANDTVRNLLFLNQKDGTFREAGELLGVAYDRSGAARGAMGIDTAVFRDDGTLAIGIGNFANEMSALFMARPGRTQFFDAAMATGFGPPSRLALTFGLLFADVDLDGRLEVLGANGHLESEIGRVQRTQRYAQPPQLFWNAGPGAASELVHVPPSKTGSDFARPMVGRGLAAADFDGDGDPDFVFTANGGPPRLLRNDTATGHHWLRLKLRGSVSNRNAIGAQIVVRTGGRTLVRSVMPTRGYCSQSELPVTVGLGDRDRVDSVTVTWPSGIVQVLEDVMIDGLTEIIEPTGKAP